MRPIGILMTVLVQTQQDDEYHVTRIRFVPDMNSANPDATRRRTDAEGNELLAVSESNLNKSNVMQVVNLDLVKAAHPNGGIEFDTLERDMSYN